MAPRYPEFLQPSLASRIRIVIGRTQGKVCVHLGLRACDLIVNDPECISTTTSLSTVHVLRMPLLAFLSVKAAKLLMKKLCIHMLLKLSHNGFNTNVILNVISWGSV